MHCRTALLLVSLCGTAVAQAPAPIPNPSVPLTVVLRGDLPIPARVLDAMEREVESLLALSHIQMSWTWSADPPRVFEQLAVVTLRGACRPNAAIPASVQFATGDPEALGKTQMVDGKVLPFADVRCDPVRKLIYRELYAKPSKQREVLLGRALGRVMAHELFHIILRSTDHGSNGLARPAQSSADLTGERDNFAPADQLRLSQSSAVSAPDEVESSGPVAGDRSESRQ
jgi:hypothetical protein